MYYFLVFNICHIVLELPVTKDKIGGSCSMNRLDSKRIQLLARKSDEAATFKMIE